MKAKVNGYLRPLPVLRGQRMLNGPMAYVCRALLMRHNVLTPPEVLSGGVVVELLPPPVNLMLPLPAQPFARLSRRRGGALHSAYGAPVIHLLL
ncbi:hypothetical protein KCP71_13435 [Salmonella enterica subsp. enterica]|nr:hypothetical protein KCP71_13435 [Salmonella enterica subsp. enterica]